MLFHRSPCIEEFETSALPYLPDLYRTAARVLRNRSEAEDAVQETYLQAWKSFHRYQPGTNCRAWLFKILFHVIQHHRRSVYGKKMVADAEQLLEETLTYEAPVPEHLTDEEMLAALDRVPARFREAVLLADVQEFSYKEISGILGIPVGTVMSRVNRGRRYLRTELESSGSSLHHSLTRKSRTAGATLTAS